MSTDQNLIITGFMGTGKSSVGPLVAEQLGRQFVDMDPLIEARAGMTIPEIFATRGEPVFRRMESVVCRDIAARSGLVIATGGGALIDAGNRRVMEASGLIVCLTADLETILARLANATDRPLIATEDQAAQIKRLLDWRQPYYEAMPAHVDTTGKTTEAVAEAVLAKWDWWHTYRQEQAALDRRYAEQSGVPKPGEEHGR